MSLAPTSSRGSSTGSSGWTTVTATADQSIAGSTTLTNDAELFFTATTGVQYEVEIVPLIISPVGAGTPDFKCAFGEDTNTLRGVITLLAYFSTGDVPDGSGAAGIATDKTTIFGLGTGTANRQVWMRGFHLGAGGTWRMLWAQNTNSANATIRAQGSLLRYRILA